MSWVPLTIFIAILVVAYYAADWLDNRDERKYQHQDETREKR
jgi:hypothetical protein